MCRKTYKKSYGMGMYYYYYYYYFKLDIIMGARIETYYFKLYIIRKILAIGYWHLQFAVAIRLQELNKSIFLSLDTAPPFSLVFSTSGAKLTAGSTIFAVMRDTGSTTDCCRFQTVVSVWFCMSSNVTSSGKRFSMTIGGKSRGFL